MKHQNYILKVLGFSALPKLFTFLFYLITLPTVLSRLGANEYGIFLYVVVLQSRYVRF